MSNESRASQMGVMKKILVGYACVAVWIFLSSSVIIFNKYILDAKMYNWPYPISLTMMHMAFCSVFAFVLVRILKVVKPVDMTRGIYVSSVVPIGALYCFSLWLSNSAYLYLSVSFIQMLKALMPVAVYSIGILFKKESFNPKTMANMVGITVGVAIAAFGEIKFNPTGILFQLTAVVFEATRLVLIQILLNAKGINLNPITSLYYIAPCCFLFLAIPWTIVEYPVLCISSCGQNICSYNEHCRGGKGLATYCNLMALKAKETGERVLDGDEEENQLLQLKLEITDESSHLGRRNDVNV
eukprot:Gb_10585 [translate_table: standard]